MLNILEYAGVVVVLVVGFYFVTGMSKKGKPTGHHAKYRLPRRTTTNSKKH